MVSIGSSLLLSCGLLVATVLLPTADAHVLANEFGGAQAGYYCHESWQTDWYNRRRLSKDACESVCMEDTGCLGIVIGDWGGVTGHCVLCTTAAITSNSGSAWATYYERLTEQPYPDGTQCLDNVKAKYKPCKNCANGFYKTDNLGPNTTYCGSPPIYARGEVCTRRCAQRCGDQGYNHWYSKGLTACGVEYPWVKGTRCAIGSSCNVCGSAATWWYGTPAGYACGVEDDWNEGTWCQIGTSCNACRDGQHKWSWSVFHTVCA